MERVIRIAHVEGCRGGCSVSASGWIVEGQEYRVEQPSCYGRGTSRRHRVTAEVACEVSKVAGRTLVRQDRLRMLLAARCFTSEERVFVWNRIKSHTPAFSTSCLNPDRARWFVLRDFANLLPQRLCRSCDRRCRKGWAGGERYSGVAVRLPLVGGGFELACFCSTDCGRPFIDQWVRRFKCKEKQRLEAEHRERESLQKSKRMLSALRKFLKTNDPGALRSALEESGQATSSPRS